MKRKYNCNIEQKSPPRKVRIHSNWYGNNTPNILSNIQTSSSSKAYQLNLRDITSINIQMDVSSQTQYEKMKLLLKYQTENLRNSERLRGLQKTILILKESFKSEELKLKLINPFLNRRSYNETDQAQKDLCLRILNLKMEVSKFTHLINLNEYEIYKLQNNLPTI